MHSRYNPVIDGAIYRSSQPDAGDLRKVVQDLGIKSVVNPPRNAPRKKLVPALRTLPPHRLVSNFVTFPSGATFPTGPRPTAPVSWCNTWRAPHAHLLLHCKAGVDRTGLGRGDRARSQPGSR